MNAPVTPAPQKGRFGVFAVELPTFTVTGRDETRSIIPISYLQRDLEIVIPRGPNFQPQDEIQLLWNGNPISAPFEIPVGTETEYTVPFAMADFPAAGTDVTGTLNYKYIDTLNFEESFCLFPLQVRFDRLRPGGNTLPPISFTDDQLSGITEADLVDGKLPLQIDPYLRIAPEDNLQIWIGTSNDEASGTWIEDLTQVVTDTEVATVINVPRAALEALGDGPRYFAYRVYDWARNVSVTSRKVIIEVALLLPVMTPPVVPEFDDDGLITFTDANPDVEVHIPPYANGGIASAGDKITLTWGTQVLPPYVLRSEDIGNDPLTVIAVPLAAVLAQGSGPVVVSYVMERGVFPPTAPVETSVEVNLATPGGPDPDPTPGLPSHGNILVPQFHCGTSPVNTVDATDYGQDGRAVISRLGVDGNAIWEEGDVVQLHWQSITDPETVMPPITIDAANEGADLDNYVVPFAGVIEVTGTGAFEVWFTVTRLLPANPNPVPVTTRSPSQTVTVFSLGEVPGGGVDLVIGRFPEADDINNNNIITRAMGNPDTTFRIPLAGVSNLELEKNPRYFYNFIGFERPGKERPIQPISMITPPPAPGLGDPITDSRKQVTPENAIALTAADLARGYIEVVLPYLDLTDYICTGFATLDYTLVNDAGSASAPTRYIYFAVNPAGLWCRIISKVQEPAEQKDL